MDISVMNRDTVNKTGLRMFAMERRRLQKVILSVLLLLVIISITDICEAEEKQPNSPQQFVRVRIFTLRNITAQQAKDYLQSAQIADTVLVIPGTTAVSVAGSPEQLVYASSVIKLVDANEKYNVQFLDIEPNKPLSAIEKIDAQLGREYSFGSLIEGPSSSAAVKAIVCLYKDKLLIIAPEEQKDKITEAVKNSLIEKQSEAEPNKADSTLRQSSVQASSPQAEPNQQSLQQLPAAIVASANDIEANATGATAIAPNSPWDEATSETQAAAPIEIKAEPNQPEDDMLGEFVGKLADAAKAEKESAFAKATADKAPKAKIEPNIIAEPEVQQVQKEIAQTTTVKNQPQNEPEPNAEPAEQQFEEEKQEQPAAKLQTTAVKTERKQEKPAEETGDSTEQPAMEAKALPVADINIPNGDEMLELNLPEKLELVALIDLVGKYLNLNYLYDETKVTGSVTIKVQGRLRVRELYNLLESVLKFRGFVMSRKGRLVTITPVAEALDQDPVFAERVKAGDVIATSVFHLKYISTAAAKKLLGEMKLGSSITEIPETGTLVITEYAFRMQRIEDLLSLVDVPGPPREFKLRVLNYTLAEVLVPKIQTLAEQLGTVNVTIGASAQPTQAPGAPSRSVRPRQPTPGQPQQATDTTKKTGVYVDFDKRTNRILMIGLINEITAVEQIIDTLDVPQQDVRAIQEYEIQYVDINKIVDALKEFGIIVIAGGAPSVSKSAVEQQMQAPGAPQAAQVTAVATQGLVSLDQPQVVMLESTNSLLVNATPEQHVQISRIISYIDREPVLAAIPYRIYRLENQEPEALAEVLNNLIEKTVKDKEGKIQKTVKYTEENIAIVPDKGTFSLIVYASKKNQEWIGNLIKSLDRRRPQVLIDVSLVEITQDNEFQIDLDVITNATNIVSTNKAILSSAINSAFPTVSPRTTLYEGGYFNGSGQVKGFYNQGNIQALLTLMDKKGYGRVLARPKILVNDNEKGKIERVETQYVQQTTDATLPGTVAGATTDTVRVTTSYTPYQAKISLEITPQISEGELLRLEIMMTREDFGTATVAGAPKNTTASNINTIVTVPDGSTIILGGLIKLNQSKGGNKVPLLGDMPVVGALFNTIDKVDTGSKLYIFVKANILRPEETIGLNQLKEISRVNKVEFEKAEAIFQQYQEIPGIKPSPVDPNRVLAQ
jgi:type II secretory pathway component GspD/PulD (secretin)